LKGVLLRQVCYEIPQRERKQQVGGKVIINTAYPGTALVPMLVLNYKSGSQLAPCVFGVERIPQLGSLT
jgi:hypothetical protein